MNERLLRELQEKTTDRAVEVVSHRGFIQISHEDHQMILDGRFTISDLEAIIAYKREIDEDSK